MSSILILLVVVVVFIEQEKIEKHRQKTQKNILEISDTKFIQKQSYTIKKADEACFLAYFLCHRLNDV